MTVRPLSYAPGTFQVPISGNIDQRLAAVAQELNRKMDAGVQGAAFHFLALISPNGTTWRVTVDDAGALATEAVPR